MLSHTNDEIPAPEFYGATTKSANQINATEKMLETPTNEQTSENTQTQNTESSKKPLPKHSLRSTKSFGDPKLMEQVKASLTASNDSYEVSEDELDDQVAQFLDSHPAIIESVLMAQEDSEAGELGDESAILMETTFVEQPSFVGELEEIEEESPMAPQSTPVPESDINVENDAEEDVTPKAINNSDLIKQITQDFIVIAKQNIKENKSAYMGVAGGLATVAIASTAAGIAAKNKKQKKKAKAIKKANQVTLNSYQSMKKNPTPLSRDISDVIRDAEVSSSDSSDSEDEENIKVETSQEVSQEPNNTQLIRKMLLDTGDIIKHNMKDNAALYGAVAAGLALTGALVGTGVYLYNNRREDQAENPDAFQKAMNAAKNSAHGSFSTQNPANVKLAGFATDEFDGPLKIDEEAAQKKQKHAKVIKDVFSIAVHHIAQSISNTYVDTSVSVSNPDGKPVLTTKTKFSRAQKHTVDDDASSGFIEELSVHDSGSELPKDEQRELAAQAVGEKVENMVGKIAQKFSKKDSKLNSSNDSIKSNGSAFDELAPGSKDFYNGRVSPSKQDKKQMKAMRESRKALAKKDNLSKNSFENLAPGSKDLSGGLNTRTSKNPKYAKQRQQNDLKTIAGDTARDLTERILLVLNESNRR